MRRARIVLVMIAAAGMPFGALGCSTDGNVSSDSSHATHKAVVDDSTTTVPRPERLDIVATDYRWSGLPDTLPAGSYPMSFRNDGAEAHEISIFRNPNHVGLTELAALGPVGIKDVVEPIGTLISGAGTASAEEIVVELTPGEYEVVCFIPTASGDGTAHFDHGMHRTLRVM